MYGRLSCAVNDLYLGGFGRPLLPKIAPMLHKSSLALVGHYITNINNANYLKGFDQMISLE